MYVLSYALTIRAPQIVESCNRQAICGGSCLLLDLFRADVALTMRTKCSHILTENFSLKSSKSDQGSFENRYLALVNVSEYTHHHQQHIFIITTEYHHPEQRLTNSEYNRGPALLSLKSNQAWFLPLLSVPSACTALQFKPQYALSCPPKINATVRESVHCSGPDVDACAHDMEAFAGLITATGRRQT